MKNGKMQTPQAVNVNSEAFGMLGDEFGEYSQVLRGTSNRIKQDIVKWCDELINNAALLEDKNLREIFGFIRGLKHALSLIKDESEEYRKRTNNNDIEGDF